MRYSHNHGDLFTEALSLKNPYLSMFLNLPFQKSVSYPLIAQVYPQVVYLII